MDGLPHSPFDTLETCFRLLSTGAACLALDGRHLGHGLPGRQIPLTELRVLLQHPATSGDVLHAVVQELVGRAMQQGDDWMVGLAGVLLPGLRRIAASVGLVDRQAGTQLEADLLELVRDAICHQASAAVQLASGVLAFAHSGWPSERPIGSHTRARQPLSLDGPL